MKTLLPLALLATLSGSVLSQSYDQIVIRDNEVVEVKFDKSINAKTTRRGDRFSATVANDRILPSGTKLIGEVAEIQRKDRDRKRASLITIALLSIVWVLACLVWGAV